jgi:hypothetical protein
LPEPEELNKAGQFSAAFIGPAQSVALIESGATSAAKWWSAGAGAAIIGAWGSVVAWWADQESGIKTSVIWAAGIVTAALALAIGYLVASDVRGRARAAAATIDARRTVAVEWIRAVVESYEPQAPQGATLIAVPALDVRLTTRPSSDENDWRVIAIERQGDGTLKYVVVKDNAEHCVPASDLIFTRP